jgi:hypothetical protein
MNDNPMKLSDTARALLALTAARDDHAMRPTQVAFAAARQVMRSLMNARVGGRGADTDRRCGFRLAHWRGRRLPCAAGDGARARRVRECEAGAPTPNSIAAEVWEATEPMQGHGGRVSIGSLQNSLHTAQDGSEDANRGGGDRLRGRLSGASEQLDDGL